MIVAHTSALVAIAFDEPERVAFVERIRQAEKVRVSAASVVEAKMAVHGRRGQRPVVLLDDLLRLPLFEIVPGAPADADAAYAAFVAFGKGSGHPTALNFGDLFGYALAKRRALPLLFKGSDFGQTDVVPAVTAAALD